MSLTNPKTNRRGQSSANLARMIFKAEVPESFVRSLPAQSLYMAVKYAGLPESAEIIEMATLEQCRLMIDFDIWSKDQVNEDNLWLWLSLEDDKKDLSLIQKVLKFIDLKLVALLIYRHVRIQIYDEATDRPPGPNYFTPDKGRSWVSIELEDQDRHFYLARFLALIFETNTDLYYQLVSIPGISTQTSLEEEAYQDKVKRLASEGIPDLEYAAEMNSPLPLTQLEAILKATPAKDKIEDIPVVEPLIYSEAFDGPLGEVFASLRDHDLFESELTSITNAAIVYWTIDYWELSQVLELARKIRGAINIGLELGLQADPSLDYPGIYARIGLSDLYRVGLAKLLGIRRIARKINTDGTDLDPSILAITEALVLPFPEAPVFFREDGTIEQVEGKLPPGQKPIERLKLAEALRKVVDQIAG